MDGSMIVCTGLSHPQSPCALHMTFNHNTTCVSLAHWAPAAPLAMACHQMSADTMCCPVFQHLAQLPPVYVNTLSLSFFPSLCHTLTLHRLGPNYLQLPVNAPQCAHHNNHHDGFMNFMHR